MEFYLASFLPIAAERDCFNSQRDGILQNSADLLLLAIGCFNSQRDGILQANDRRD